MVEHLVLFKLKETTTSEERAEIVETLYTLASIEGIVEFSAGVNHSEEGKSNGFEVGMRIAFRNREALDAYLPSEPHQTTIGKIREHFADVIVLDYTH